MRDTIFTILVAAGVAACAPAMEARVLSTGEPIRDVKALAEAVRGADVVIVGEVHDNPGHQALAARLIREIAPAGVAFEMVEASQVEAAAAGDFSHHPDLARYAEPLAAARASRIVGAGLPRDIVRRAMEEGVAATFPGDPIRFGLDAPLDAAAQVELEDELFASHCNALPAEMMPAMVEAQRLRDAAFAKAALDAREGAYRSLSPGTVMRAPIGARRFISAPPRRS